MSSPRSSATDFSDDEAWASIAAGAARGNGHGFRADVDIVDGVFPGFA